MKKIEFVAIIFLFLLTFLLRLYKITSPVADWHSWRQVDTSAVSRTFVENGYDILHPQYHDISNIASGIDNPQGYRFVEFPLFNLVQALAYQLIGIFSLETWGRLISVIASAMSAVFLFLIVKKYSDITAAFFSSFFYAVIPFNIYFGRVILPDSSMISAVLGGIYFFDKWLEYKSKKQNRNRIYFFLSIVFIAGALLLKPYAVFFILPIIYLAWMHFGNKFLLKWQFIFFCVLVGIPLVLWRVWIQQFPEGIPVSNWLFNKDNIRFKGAFFYYIFAERIGKLIFGYWGIGIFVLGMIRKLSPRKMAFFYTFLISALLYMFVIAGGNVQHDYYQIAIIPSLTIFLGLGANFLLTNAKETNKHISYIVFIIFALFMFAFGWYGVRGYYNYDANLVKAGIAVDQLIPKDAKVIALSSGVGDTTFLYYTGRKGWPSFQNPLPEMILKGATHLILLNPQERDYEFGMDYKIIASTKEYLIFDLHQMP